MKILIICLPRTGSTNHMIKLSKEFSLKVIGEPFNDSSNYYKKYKDYDWKSHDDFIIKTVIGHLPTIESERGTNPVVFYRQFYKLFDKTVLLSRRDFNACVESFSYMSYHSKLNGMKFDDPYVYTRTPHYDYIYNQLYEYKIWMEELSQKINIPITYYEDIFDINSNNRLRKNPITNKLF